MVTGPSSGIGRATALGLAAQDFHVVAAGRSVDRVGMVIEQIRRTGGSAEFLSLDLASLESARAAARSFAASGRALDVLVNNAAVGLGRGLTSDGFEIHFGVNHLGHFMLTDQLSEVIPVGGRVVQITSSVHHRATGFDFEWCYQKTRSPLGLDEYAKSKLANVLFVRELATRRPDWRVYAVHPGLTDTRLIPAWIKPALRRRLLTAEEGADTPVWCATSEELAGQSGLYYARRAAEEPSHVARDDALSHNLWVRSEQWCNPGSHGG
jgi:NAD(P)-dependent dehydrogenase (short-subunit alcohol dehydrogenase family)